MHIARITTGNCCTARLLRADASSSDSFRTSNEEGSDRAIAKGWNYHQGPGEPRISLPKADVPVLVSFAPRVIMRASSAHLIHRQHAPLQSGCGPLAIFCAHTPCCTQARSALQRACSYCNGSPRSLQASLVFLLYQSHFSVHHAGRCRDAAFTVVRIT